MDTVAEGIAARAVDERPGLVAGEFVWTWAEVVKLSQGRRSSLHVPGRARHIGVLLDNVPEFCFWLGAAALGKCARWWEPDHRGDELARDISHTECQLLVTDSAHLRLSTGSISVRASEWRRRTIRASSSSTPRLRKGRGGRRGGGRFIEAGRTR